MELCIEGKRRDSERLSMTLRVAASELEALERGAYLVVIQSKGLDLADRLSPRDFARRELGEEHADSLMHIALKNFVAPFALSQDGGDYSVVGAPVFDEGWNHNDAGDLVIEASWALLPELELSSFDPVEITAPAAQVSEESIDARMDEIAESYVTLERDADRGTVEDGSIAQISMECLKDGKRFDQLCFKGRPYRAGSGQMPKPFDEVLIGAAVGQTVHVDFVLPVREGVDGTMTGPSIAADVTVGAIMREVACELTDEFVSSNIPGADSLADLRERTRKELEGQQEEQMRHQRNFLAAQALAERLVGCIPDSAYDAISEQLADPLRKQARAEGKAFGEFLEEQGSSEQQFRMMSLVQARSQLRQGAALDAWARHRNIEVTDDDIAAFFESSAQGQGQGAKMRKEIEQGGYLYLAREGARRLKASEDLVAGAIIHETADEP